MDMDIFAAKICAAVKEKLGDGYKVTVKDVKKNNGVLMKGLLIFSSEQGMTPTIYLDSFKEAYESGMPIRAAADKIVAIYRRDSIKTEDIDMDFLLDYRKAKDRVCYRLVGRKDNEELLADIPHMEFLDLAICFYYDYQREGMGDGIIIIHNSHMAMWDVSVDDLFLLAQRNTPCLRPWEYSTIGKVLQEMEEAGEEIPFGSEDAVIEAVPMRILGNERRAQGAACILYPGVLDEIAAREGRSFYIIPSSVHEVIILPDDGNGSPEAFKRMIAEVNRTQLAPEEVLSDSLYYYDAVKRETVIM